MTEKYKYRCAAVYNAKQILVHTENGFMKAYCSPKLKEPVLVGDYLSCDWIGNDLYALSISQRLQVVKRLKDGRLQGLVSNVNIVFIVTSINQDFNIARLERYYVIARESKARICFVLSKCDLNEDYEEYANILRQRFPQCQVAATSAYQYNPDNFMLFEYWKEQETAVFLGSSGVGKSTMINLMIGGEVIKTQDIRKKDDHGRHTTTIRQMFFLPNNRVIIDTPGIRSVGIETDSDSIDELFPEIKSIEKSCKYKKCSHVSEPNCAIREALETGELDYSRYMRYLKLCGEEKRRLTFSSGKEYERKDAMKQLRKRKY